MLLLIQYTLIFASVLILVALGGCFSEHSGVINIGLDPVFIFVLHMGVSGAALATILSQALSAAWVLRFLTSKKSGVRLSLRTMKPDFSILGSVMALGISPFIMSATESAITIVMTTGYRRTAATSMSAR